MEKRTLIEILPSILLTGLSKVGVTVNTPRTFPMRKKRYPLEKFEKLTSELTNRNLQFIIDEEYFRNSTIDTG
ncbi:MAG TPA: hypothetical protein VFJ51_14875 [Nitrososphaeraceae archaeon]|nr:hypothetical protein [Nitrososphaeraceae archaeon]